MIFLTVGTQFPFDRLVQAIDEAAGKQLLEDEVFGQIGQTHYRPQHFNYVETLKKDDFDQTIHQADGIISHAGMGSITMAMEYDKPLLVMPRRAKFGEVVNDHQVAIATRYEQLHYLLVAYDAADLPEKIKILKDFVPEKRQVQLQPVLDRLDRFLAEQLERKYKDHVIYKSESLG